VKFLLEIGVEEVPDWMLAAAVAHLREQIAALSLKVVLAEATPRRLAIIADRVPEREADRTEIIKGPPVAAPAAAVEGFARKHGVDASALSPDGAYYTLTKHIPGRATKDILAEKLPGLILGIPWPKTMLWPGKGGARFIRPIRWIVCLLGKDIVPFSVNGVPSGDATRGHRQLGRKKPIRVSISSYEKTLERNGVILSAARRREKIVTEVGQDTPLVDLHVYLNEWPAALRGSFDPAYLSLPEEVLETVMRHHQKYFAVRTEDGRLAPEFVAVMNRPDDPEGLIRAGNERVLRARFNDARFFYEVDMKRPLADRVPDLAKVTFHRELGSYADKVARMKQYSADPDFHLAVELCKVDLTSEMVKEFTELQGVIGGRYAEAQGLPAAIATAIYEHYRPQSMEDAIPSTPLGQWLSFADKMDTLTEMFRIGQIPSGSKDPLALRRAAQGVVRILVEGSIGPKLEMSDTLREFFLDRVRYYFRDVKGFAYDEVNAVLAVRWDDLKDAQARLQALAAVRKTENFEPLAAAFKRIKNILRQAGFTPSAPLDESLLEPGAEAELHAAARAIDLSGDYSSDLAAIASLRPRVDAFFDKVLVNAVDPAVRANRLTLLFGLLREFSQVADFSEIVAAG
jgi:glycyl-tRNA synthetase beta chain